MEKKALVSNKTLFYVQENWWSYGGDSYELANALTTYSHVSTPSSTTSIEIRNSVPILPKMTSNNISNANNNQTHEVVDLSATLFNKIEEAARYNNYSASQYVKTLDSTLLNLIKHKDGNALHFTISKINDKNYIQINTLISTLIKQGMSVNAKNPEGSTLLHLICARNDIDHIPFLLVNFLLNHKIVGAEAADVNICNLNKDTPLHVLCANKVLRPELAASIAGLLIEKSKNLNGTNSQGYTPLDLAIQAQQHQVAEMLMKKGALVTQYYLDYLRKCDLDCPKYIDFYSKLNYYCQDQKHVHSLASYSLQHQQQSNNNSRFAQTNLTILNDRVAKLFKLIEGTILFNNDIELNAHINQLDNELLNLAILNNGNNALHELCKGYSEINQVVVRQVIKNLIQKGININTQNLNGFTPLHLVCASYSITQGLIEILLNNHADPDIKDHKENTAFHIICSNPVLNSSGKLKEVVGDLIKKSKKKSFNERNKEGKTALDLACHSKLYKAADALMEHGALLAIETLTHSIESGDQEFLERLFLYCKNQQHLLAGPTKVNAAVNTGGNPDGSNSVMMIDSDDGSSLEITGWTSSTLTNPGQGAIMDLNSQ